MRSAPASPPRSPDPGAEFRGWVQLGLSDDIRRRTATTVRRFGRDIVTWFDASGALHALDASEVAGGDDVAMLPVVDLGGVAFMYRWPPGAGPRHGDPPPLAASDIGAALVATDRLRSTYSLRVTTTVPGFVDNIVDRAHFASLHGGTVKYAGPCRTEIRDDGSFVSDMDLTINAFLGIPSKSNAYITLTDPFNGMTRNSFFGGAWHEIIALLGPRGDHTIDVLFVMISPATIWWYGRIPHAMTMRYSRRTILQDKAVLATRTFPERPILSDVDGPFFAVRRWLDGFRSPAPAADEGRTARPVVLAGHHPPAGDGWNR